VTNNKENADMLNGYAMWLKKVMKDSNALELKKGYDMLNGDGLRRKERMIH
jgi:hypothetical protein